MFKFTILCFVVLLSPLWARETLLATDEVDTEISKTLQDFSIETTDQLIVLPDHHISQVFKTSGDEYANMETIFERVIGLGSTCSTKAKINGYFHPQERIKTKTKKGHADLFDWKGIYNYDKFAYGLNRKLEGYFNLENLTLKILERYSLPPSFFQNQEYGINFSHIFDNFKDINLFNNSSQQDNLVSYYEVIRHKLDYLKEKFIAAKIKKTLYVIQHNYPGPSLETLIKFRDGLITIREGDKNFVLLYIPQKKEFEEFENIIIFEDDNSTIDRNRGDCNRWKEILDNFRFTPDIWA